MKIYITDLEAYNNGNLIGEWVELPMNEDLLAESIENVCYAGKKACGSEHYHEEVFITDYEAIINVEEYDDINRLNEIAEILEEYSEGDFLKLKLLSHEGYEEREVIDTGIDNYDVSIYDFRSNTSFTDTFELLAMQFVDDGVYGEIPKSLEFYLDYEKMARDLRMDYTEFESNIIGRVF
ncbi:antirestriction protein ArdA [Sulfurimonas sp. SAG-AH-194-C21]|nr:antirestriction protein ArdA [Sulfurimonas sp. SAG-AH-194-C21]MDF1882708.1 antirestriction protein ArdA [Sulfurimonas sp. SAG-AH-194-C21]